MKQLLLIVALLVCIGLIEINAEEIDLMPESPAFPTNEQELAELQEKVFSDFCLSTRDYVVNELKNGPKELASKFVKYSQGMTPGSRFLLERASLKLFNQVENPDAPIEDLFANYPYDIHIEAGLQKIKQTKTLSDRYMLALSYFWLTYTKFNRDELESKLRQAKSQEEFDRIYKSTENDSSNMDEYMTTIKDNFLQSKSELESKHSSVVGIELNKALQEGCSEFNEYKTVIGQKFGESKLSVVSKDRSVEKVELENVGCLTSKRVLNAVAVCTFIEAATRPISSILKEEAENQ